MVVTHLYALIPLLVLLILSLIFYGRGLVHLLTFSYVIALAFMAVTNNWEIVFLPLLTISGIITIILFWYAMVRGGWL